MSKFQRDGPRKVAKGGGIRSSVRKRKRGREFGESELRRELTKREKSFRKKKKNKELQGQKQKKQRRSSLRGAPVRKNKKKETENESKTEGK